MNVHVMEKLQPAITDWRAVLAELGPLIAEEGRRCDAANEFVGANIAALRERGFLGLAVPAELGGGGLSLRELADVLRSLAHHCSSTALALSMHTHVTATVAWKWRHLQAPFEGLLRQIATGRLQMLSSGGSDGLPGSGEAVKVDGGYRIKARKIFASGAPSANLFMTGAIEHDPLADPVVLHFGVPMNAEGISIAETWDTLGMRGTASHEVVLDNVFVPDAAIAARRKAGVWHPAIHIAMMVAIPLVYAVYTGIAETARDIAVGAAKKRRDVNLDALGALDTELAATRIALNDLVNFAETAQPGPKTTNAIFIGRALIGRGAARTVELALEAAGGAGYFRKLGLEKLFRDVQAARFHVMADWQQRCMAGRLALDLPIDE
jgi:alkylation response protein AidB-like acyl-CoA dehydrogenase